MKQINGLTKQFSLEAQEWLVNLWLFTICDAAMILSAQP